MAEFLQTLLDASKTDVLYGAPIETTGLSDIWFEFIVSATTADFVGSVVLTGGNQIAPAGQNYVNLEGAGGTAQTVRPAGWGDVSGFVVTWTNPAAGTTRYVIRMPNPPKYISPYYDYTSGGGTLRVRILAWGWGSATIAGRTF